MQLHQLVHRRGKGKKEHVLMVDSKEKCTAYMKARQATKGTKSSQGKYEIVLAPPDEKVWKQKTATNGGNKPLYGPTVIGKGHPGWIGKNGFNAHT